MQHHEEVLRARSEEPRVGISGWSYPSWKGRFYPKSLPAARELEYASRQVNTLELNGTFYRLQRPESYLAWRDCTPDDFVFAVKANRYITHYRKLFDVEIPLANFFASGVLALKEKLGPILWQFPPHMKFEEESFEVFLSKLPRNTNQACKLASRHQAWLEGRTCLEPTRGVRLRHAVEVRDPSFLTPEFVRLLRRYSVALVFSDSGGRWPYAEDLTADFVYLRLHGAKRLYSSGYSLSELRDWAERVRHWQAGGQRPGAPQVVASAPRAIRRDAFIYFDNDAKVRAPFDAMALREMLVGYRPVTEPVKRAVA